MQRILIVDDEHLVADTLALIFAKNGFEARAAYSAEEARRCARNFKPELLLCDITMPGEDGHKLVDDIAVDLPACRILILTGYYSNLKQVREHILRLSRPIGVLTKPCQPTDLLREAREMLATA